jgi:hypothetical protein
MLLGVLVVAVALLAVLGPNGGTTRIGALPRGEGDSPHPVSGQPMPEGDIPGWHQVFAYDFSGENAPLGAFSRCIHTTTVLRQDSCSGLRGDSRLYQHWAAYPDGWPDSRYGTYYPSRVLSIHNGVMDYHIHTETINGISYHMTAAAVPKVPGGVNGGGLLYGRYVIRARFDSLRGYHVAFLLWPDDRVWPGGGEIDFPDDALDSSTIGAFMHWQGATTHRQFDHYSVHASLGAWHTYEIDWLPTAVSFYLDGSLLGKSTSHIPDTPMHWVLQTDTASGEPPPSVATAGDVQIAWATAYTPTTVTP